MAENKVVSDADVEETKEKRSAIGVFGNRDECTYTRCYCEENIWKLCASVRDNHPDELSKCFAVFISNKNKQIPLWMQASSKRDDRLVIWDYHVIFLHKGDDSTLVYDLDTELPFPCDFVEYAMKGLRDDRRMKEDFRRSFRVTHANEFLQTFASDRSHMLSEEGEWLMPPPVYPCIATTASKNNIQFFISMDPNEGFGTVMDSVTFIKTFSNPAAAADT
ncbi:protein N-terminal glutamine amidohydrolase-like [Haliotis cracherodii]|uniref:protein N-terminal glutamine amidohydrolase-like n=1 Tax=Haliotis cracherodii TaxID=6455 RepID=UPI0039E919E9